MLKVQIHVYGVSRISTFVQRSRKPIEHIQSSGNYKHDMSIFIILILLIISPHPCESYVISIGNSSRS